MNTKRAIKRMFLTLMWIGVAAGMVILITAAMRVQETGICKGYQIKIKGFREDMLFTTDAQIEKLLKAATNGNVKGQRKNEFNLPVIEDLLEQSSWVYNADLYFDNNDVLHANVTEREPIARIFSTLGESFYIDAAGKHIPLSDRVTLDLPVFTGYPVKKILKPADSALIQNVVATASFINADSFWTSQVSQVDIKNCGADCWNMEMVPVVGNHKVDLGDGSDIASKFHRLYLFYDQVLKRTGFDKYQKIDVQYDGQVVGVKGNYTKVDSLQLKKNIETLLQQSRKTNEMLEVAPALAGNGALKQNIPVADEAIYTPVEQLPTDTLMLEEEDKLVNKTPEPTKIAPVKKPAPAKSVITKPAAIKIEKKESDKKPLAAATLKATTSSAKKPVIKSSTATNKPEVKATNNNKNKTVTTDKNKKEAVKKPDAVKPKPATKQQVAVAKKPEAKTATASKNIVKPKPKPNTDKTKKLQ